MKDFFIVAFISILFLQSCENSETISESNKLSHGETNQEQQLTSDSNNDSLVEAEHSIDDFALEYIDKIALYLNEDELDSLLLTFEPEKDLQNDFTTYHFSINKTDHTITLYYDEPVSLSVTIMNQDPKKLDPIFKEIHTKLIAKLGNPSLNIEESMEGNKIIEWDNVEVMNSTVKYALELDLDKVVYTQTFLNPNSIDENSDGEWVQVGEDGRWVFMPN